MYLAINQFGICLARSKLVLHFGIALMLELLEGRVDIEGCKGLHLIQTIGKNHSILHGRYSTKAGTGKKLAAERAQTKKTCVHVCQSNASSRAPDIQYFMYTIFTLWHATFFLAAMRARKGKKDKGVA